MADKKTDKESRNATLPGHSGSSPSLQPIKLPKPKLDRGKSVASALHQRKTIREFSDKKLPLQVLSDLLWAAWC